MITALLEVQRGLAERFSRELTLAGSFTNREQQATTRTELLAKIRARPEVRRCDIVSPAERDGAWAEMLREWEMQTQHAGASVIRMALLESEERSVLIRDLGPVDGTMVVMLSPQSNFGTIKHLVEKFTQLPADESLSPSHNRAGHTKGHTP